MTKTERALLNDAARIIEMSYKGFDAGTTLDYFDQCRDWLRAYRLYTSKKR